MKEVFSCFYSCPLRTCGISIALTIRSLDPHWGLVTLSYTGSWRFYTPSAPLGLLEAGAQCAPYKCTFQTGSKSETEFFLEKGTLWDFYKISIAVAIRSLDHSFSLA